MVYSVNFMAGTWCAADGSLAAAAEKANEPQLSEKMMAVLEFVNSRECTVAADVVKHLPDISASTARQYLTRLTDYSSSGALLKGCMGL
jgi:hypothetical protein